MMTHLAGRGLRLSRTTRDELRDPRSCSRYDTCRHGIEVTMNDRQVLCGVVMGFVGLALGVVAGVFFSEMLGMTWKDQAAVEVSQPACNKDLFGSMWSALGRDGLPDTVYFCGCNEKEWLAIRSQKNTVPSQR
jgi:hypothetical protein